MESKQQLHLELGHQAEDKTREAFEPAWRKLRDYCRRDLRFGEIVLFVQDGLPVTGDHVKKKIRFG